MSSHPVTVFSTSEALSFAWAEMKEHLGPLLVVSFFGAAMAGLNQALMSRGAGGAFLSLVLQLAQVAITMAGLRLALRIVDGDAVQLPSLKDVGPEFFSFLLVSLLGGLIIAAGLLLLIVPGILAALMFGFASFVVVDQKLGPIEALKESARLTHGLRGELAALGLALVVLNLLGLLALGVGLMVTVPMTALAAAQVYRRLQARAGARSDSLPGVPPTMAASHSSNPQGGPS